MLGWVWNPKDLIWNRRTRIWHTYVFSKNETHSFTFKTRDSQKISETGLRIKNNPKYGWPDQIRPNYGSNNFPWASYTDRFWLDRAGYQYSMPLRYRAGSSVVAFYTTECFHCTLSVHIKGTSIIISLNDTQPCQWVTLLHWVTCSFVTMNTYSAVYSDSFSHTHPKYSQEQWFSEWVPSGGAAGAALFHFYGLSSMLHHS